MTNDSFNDTTVALLTDASVSSFMARKISAPDGVSASPVCQATLLALIADPLGNPSFPLSLLLLYVSTLQPDSALAVVGPYWISQSAMSPIRSSGALKSGTPTSFSSVVIA